FDAAMIESPLGNERMIHANAAGGRVGMEIKCRLAREEKRDVAGASHNVPRPGGFSRSCDIAASSRRLERSTEPRYKHISGTSHPVNIAWSCERGLDIAAASSRVKSTSDGPGVNVAAPGASAH